AADPKENQRLKRTNVLISIPDGTHIIILISSADGSTAETTRNETVFLSMNSVNQSRDGFIVEVYISDGCEQSFDDESVSIFCNHISVSLGGAGKSDQCACQFVLK